MTSKRCGRCREEKNFSEFYLDSSRGDRTTWACKECLKKASVLHQKTKKGRDYNSRWRRNRRERAKKIVDRYKVFKGCFVCGYNKSPCALDLHHLNPDKKKKKIANMVGARSLSALRAEIRKCVVLCANCHRGLHGGFLTLDGVIDLQRDGGADGEAQDTEPDKA